MEQKPSLLKELISDKRLVITIVCILLLAAAAIAAIFAYSDRAKQYFYEAHLSSGYEAMDAEQYTEAIAQFEDAYRLNPTDAAALGLVDAWDKSGDTQRAIGILMARMSMYESTPAMEELLVTLRESIGIYEKVSIGGNKYDRTTTAIMLEDITLTEEDKENIGQFTDLVTLSLINCGLTDIDFLADCNKLLSVTLSGNPISDITPLHNKDNLRTLYLNDTAITDYSQLHSLTALSTLNLNGNWILEEDLEALCSALSGCTIYSVPDFIISTVTIGEHSFTSDTTELDLSGMGLSDLSFLQEFTNLQKLDLSDNNITYITQMEGLKKLTYLDLSNNGISNISALETMKKLTYLDVSHNKVTDLTPVGSLKKLTALHADGNPLYHGHDDLAGLENLTTLSLRDSLMQNSYLSDLPMASLTKLDLRDNAKLSESKLTALAEQAPNCKILHDFTPDEVTLGTKAYDIESAEIDASHSEVVDLAPLCDFTHLTALDLSGNGISDFSPLGAMTELTELNLRATGLSDLSVLSALTKLTKLNLGENSLTDLTPISTLTKLTDLTLSGNKNLSSLSALSALTELTKLRLDGTAVTDLTAVAALPKLDTLYLDGCAVADFTQLYGCTALKSLYIIDCGITPEGLYALQQALPDCTIYAGDVTAASPTPEATAAPTA